MSRSVQRVNLVILLVRPATAYQQVNVLLAIQVISYLVIITVDIYVRVVLFLIHLLSNVTFVILNALSALMAQATAALLV